MIIPDEINFPSDRFTKFSSDVEVLYLGYSKHFELTTGNIIKGLYGYSISKKPKYSTFQNLLYGEGVMIDKGISYDESMLTSIKVEATAELPEYNADIPIEHSVNILSVTNILFL